MEIYMSNGELNQEQVYQIARGGIKKLIERNNNANGKDPQTLSMLLEQISKTPLYVAVQKGCDVKNAKSINFITLTIGGQVFIPVFTGPEDFGKLKDSCDFVCMHPMDYFQVLISKDRYAVINPFGSYFLMWSELIREHMLPYMQECEEFKKKNEGQLPQ